MFPYNKYHAPVSLMASSKRLHAVQFTGTMEQNNNAADVDTTYLYIDRELSSQYGKSFRNGMINRLVGWDFHIRPKDTGVLDDFDLGGSISGQLEYIPVNKHTVKAWGLGYDLFQSQKRLSGRIGKSVRYDDFEISYDNPGADTRTSIIDDNPIATTFGGSGGGDGHRVGFFDDSNDTSNYTSLSDLYNSRFTPPAASETHYGVDIKAPKFGNAYLPSQAGESIWMNAYNSTLGSGGTGLTFYHNASTDGTTEFLPAGTHIPLLTGSLKFGLQWSPKDTVSVVEDDIYWSLILYLEGWKPIPTLYGSKKKRSKTAKRRMKKGGRRTSRS